LDNARDRIPDARRSNEKTKEKRISPPTIDPKKRVTKTPICVTSSNFRFLKQEKFLREENRKRKFFLFWSLSREFVTRRFSFSGSRINAFI
jgi:hypothetical protein